MLGLEGEEPERIDPDMIETRVRGFASVARWICWGSTRLPFRSASTWCFTGAELPFIRTDALCGVGAAARSSSRSSTTDRGASWWTSAAGADRIREDDRTLPHPFRSGASCSSAAAAGVAISRLMIETKPVASESETHAGLARIWQAMQTACGALQPRRRAAGGSSRPRAAELHRQLSAAPEAPCVTR